jgi:hypothetical protein
MPSHLNRHAPLWERGAPLWERFAYIRIQILVFALLLPGTALLLRPVQEAAERQSAALQARALGQAEAALGLRLSYRAAGASLLGGLDLRGLVITTRESGGPTLRVERLRLGWNLGALIRRGREDPLRALTSLRLDSPALEGSSEQIAAFFRAFAGKGEKAPPGARDISITLNTLLPEGFLVRVRNGTYSGAIAGIPVEAAAVNLDASFSGGTLAFLCRANAEGLLPAGEGPLAALEGHAETSVKVNGTLDGDLGRGEAWLGVSRARGASFDIRPFICHVSMKDDELTAEGTFAKKALAVTARHHLRSGSGAAALSMRDFRPSGMLRLDGALAAYAPWLDMAFSGEAALERDASGQASYRVTLDGAFPERTPGDAQRVVTLNRGVFSLDVRGDERRAAVNRARFASGGGSVFFSGRVGLAPFAPAGELRLTDLSLRRVKGGGALPVSGALTVSTRGGAISLFGDECTVGTVTLNGLNAALVREKGGISFRAEAIRYRNVESWDDVRTSFLSLEGAYDRAPRHFQTSLTLDSFSAEDIINLAGPFAPDLGAPARDAAKNISITADIFINTDFSHVLYNATRFVAAWQGKPNLLFVMSVSGTERRVDIEAGRIVWPRGEAELAGYADFADMQDISFYFGTTWKNLTYYFDGVLLERRALSLRGSYGIEAYIGHEDGYAGYLQTENVPFPSGAGLALTKLSSSFRFNTKDDWQARIDSLQVTGLAIPGAAPADITLKGQGDQNGIVLESITFDDGKGALEGSGWLFWEEGYLRPRVSLSAFDAGRREQYALDAAYEDGMVTATLFGKEMRFSRFNGAIPPGTATGNLRLRGSSLESFRADLNLAAFSFRWGDSTLSGALSAAFSEDEASVRDLSLDWQDFRVDAPLIRIDRAASRAQCSASVQGVLGGRALAAGFSVEAAFSPFRAWRGAAEGLSAFSGTITVSRAAWGDLAAEEPFSLRVERRLGKGAGGGMERSVSVSGGPSNLIRMRYFESGDFYAALVAPSPLRGAITGTLTAKALALETRNMYADLAALWRFMPARDENAIRVTSGFANVDLRISGSMSDPEFNGRIRGTSVRVAVPKFLAEPIRPEPFEARVAGGEIALGPVDCAVGDGIGIAEALFRFERWAPRVMTINIDVPSETAVPARISIGPVSASGRGEGRLAIHLEDQIVSVTGEVTLNDTVAAMDMSKLGGGRGIGPPRGNLSTAVNLTVKTGRKVEFLWPNPQMPILQAYADLGSALTITFDNLIGRFAVQGDVSLRSGEIFYFERSFYIREGTLFFNENEARVNPRISARAEIRDHSDEEGEVTISMIIDNAYLSSFTARFESTPSLSQAEIFNILGQNVTGTQSGEAGNQIIAGATDALMQFTLFRRMQRGLRDFLRLDMLSFRTQLLQNALFQTIGTGTEGGSAYRAGTFFDNTSILLGKYIGSDMFAQAMVSFRYDENNPASGGLRIEPDIGLDMHSPLVDISMNITPLHVENWFLDDVNFKVTWRRSF